MARETAAERRRREIDMINRATRNAREEVLRELRMLLGVLDEDDVRSIAREEIDSHKWSDHA